MCCSCIRIRYTGDLFGVQQYYPGTYIGITCIHSGTFSSLSPSGPSELNELFASSELQC